jgi:hypothetical protein
MGTKKTLLQKVVQWPHEQVVAWLDGLAIGEPVGGEFFNWVLFATVIASRAREERSLQRANIALMVYGVLTERTSDDDWKHSLTFKAMNLRGWLIMELGAREGDAVLDPEFIVAWFRSEATMPIEEAARLALAFREEPRSVPIETLLKLRYIKSALNVVSLISERGVVQKHPELENWLQLRPRLP